MSSKFATRKEAEAYLQDKAERDDRFRRELIANPKETIAKELDLPLPPNVNVRVIEETARDIVLVLPAKVTARGELAEAELDAVAGGAALVAGGIKGSVGIESPTKLNFGSGGFNGGV